MSDLGAIGLSFRLPSDAIDIHLNTLTLSGSSMAANGGGTGEASIGAYSGPTINVLYPSLPGIAQAAGDGVKRVVSGIVYDGGVALAACTVKAFRRSDGALLGTTITDGSGAFSISIYGETAEVNVVAYDIAGGTSYNDIVQSQIVPV